MSYKLNKITFMNKKAPLKSIDLKAPNSKFTDIFVSDKIQNRFVKRVLQGKEKIAKGRYQIDNQELIGYGFAKTKIQFIGQDKWVDRLIPPKWILYGSLFFDLKFVRQARVKTNDKKYDYLSFKDSENDLDDMKIRRKIDLVISKFINDTTKAEVQLLEDYFSKISVINNEKATKIFSDYYVQIKVLANENASLREELANSELLLTFYQSLWDKIYSFDELRNSCTCEFNVKASSNKLMKKKLTKFKYSQTHFMVKKQLKFINIRISELRILIYKLKKTKRRVSKQLSLEITKYHTFNQIDKQKQLEITNELNNWKNFNGDLRQEFEIKQKEIFFDLLSHENIMVGKKIIYLIHEYHTKVLSSTEEMGKQNEFKILKRHYKKQIESIFEQAHDWINEIINKLDIKFDWYLKNGFKISSLNEIYLKIIQAINLKKDNIILTKNIALFSKNDLNSLNKTFKKIIEHYPELTFIGLSDNFYEISDFSKEIYTPDKKGNLISVSPSKLYDLNSGVIRNKWFTNYNIFAYKKVDNGIEIEKKFWSLNEHTFEDAGTIFINPFEIKTKENPNVKEQLPLIVKIKLTNKFVDKNMHLGITEHGNRIYFYSKSKFDVNNEYVIYLQNTSITQKF